MHHMALNHDEYLATRHFAGFDGLRALAVIAVIFHHCYWGRVLILGRGFLGVDFFFVLSGFLIGTLLIRERAATGTINLGAFWLRRCRRLLPALYLLLGGLALYFSLAKGGSDESWQFFHDLPASAMFVSNWVKVAAHGVGHLWSLATEEQFYLAWPLALMLAPRFAPIVFGAALGVAAIVSTGLIGAPPAWLAKAIAMYAPLALGVASAHLLHHRRGFEKVAPLLGCAVAPWVATIILLSLLAFAPVDLSGTPRMAIQASMAILLLTMVIRPGSPLVRALEFAPIARIGIISYGVYLYHFVGLHIAGSVLHRDVGMNGGGAYFVITAAASIVIAEISFRIVEQPAKTYRPASGFAWLLAKTKQ
jgi:peptidoglycan/LPS O-acetylase OafA/YrhL